MHNRFHLPAGSTAAGPWTLASTPATAGWTYSGLRVLDLPAGGAQAFATGGEEMLVLPLSGSATVDCCGQRFELAGRPDVFAGVTDFAYLPTETEVVVSSPGGARLALPSARADRRLPARYGPAADVPVELRGAGQCSRQVHNFCTPEAFETDKLIACEVLTPAGNWSSYPPHKHDQDRPGESVLEEIYYFEIAAGPTGPGLAYQRVYGSPGQDIDVLAEVGTGDVVLVPHGWHGPSMAVPGYDLYYLNVMAGPGAERAWLICDDPAHGWIRDTWRDQEIDPRLPMGAPKAAT
ncbi:MAG TPA: 5-deoxy-glucuronate isomerase [Pseudonocardiaceae bacterium]|nr:5-deoxy-glucuronate isomerase [Pseudonocardiaceae bacterium]